MLGFNNTSLLYSERSSGGQQSRTSKKSPVLSDGNQTCQRGGDYDGAMRNSWLKNVEKVLLSTHLFSIFNWLRQKLRQHFRSRQLATLRQRWEMNPSALNGKPSLSRALPIYDRIKVRVINLENREDRLRQIGVNLTSVGITQWDRIIGINGRAVLPKASGMIAGSVGCELSHIAAISAGAPSHVEGIMICEDDLEFVGSAEEVEIAIRDFLNDSRLDVLSLSGRPRGGSIHVSNNLRVVIGLVGRGCYIIKPHMVNPLVQTFSDGLKKLNRGKIRGKGDLEWRRAQAREYFFAFPRKDLAQQSSGFSDIEGKLLGPR